MAKTNTSLSAAVTAGSLEFPFTSVTGLVVGMQFQVDAEMLVVAAINGSVVTARMRGDYGTKAVAHDQLAPVGFGAASDFGAPPPGDTKYSDLANNDVQSYGASGAVDVDKIVAKHTTIEITKATAAALTLAAPSDKTPEGATVTFLSVTDAAHTVDYTAGFYGDTSSSNLATFTNKKGSSFTIVKRQGTWGVQSLANVTLG